MSRSTPSTPRLPEQILADWEATRAESAALTFDIPDWKAKAADLAERDAALVEEAAHLPTVPNTIVQYLVGYYTSSLRQHAARMRGEAQ